MGHPLDPARAETTLAGGRPRLPAADASPHDTPLVPVSLPQRMALPPPRRRVWPLLLVGLLLLAAAATAGWFLAWQPVTVTTLQPRRGTALEAVYATGIVEAIDTARAGSTVAGRVVSVSVQEGDRVRTGQMLAQLDDRQAQQRLDDARARLELAEQELARDRSLVPTGIRSVQAMQRSQAERDRAEAGVALAQRDVGEYRILAPLDGIVMRREVDPGNTVAANAALFTVASTARLRVAADVDERDIAQVRLGAPVAIRADAYPGEAFAARVTNIRRQGDTATRTFRVEADLPAGSKLYIGMTVDVNVVVAQRADALLLPPAAVRHDPPQGGQPGQAYVLEPQNGRAHRVDVELGAVGATSVEVRRGLAPDARVIADPAGLADGRRVRVVP